MKKRKKKTPLRIAQDNLWDACRAFIYVRDNDTCFTCGKYVGKGHQAGHFIPSSTCGILLRYDERNIHVQCYHCNMNLGGYGAMYTIKMKEKYGQKLIDKLWEIKNKSTGTVKEKWEIKDYEKKTEYYELKLAELSGEMSIFVDL
jgi:DNA-directed RNA polymerase subunit N (RpoN/RPB10)